MTDEVLTPPVPPVELSAEDAAVFERVWRRVMAGREGEPGLPVPVEPPAPPVPAPGGQTDGLLEQLRLHAASWQASRGLARRASGSMARVLSGVAAEDRRQLARLAAAWYVMTGQRWRHEEGKQTPLPDLMEGLRQQYLHRRDAARLLEQAARVGEESFEGLYADLASHNRESARLVLRLLEQMQM